jgi:hypothetical protein
MNCPKPIPAWLVCDSCGDYFEIELRKPTDIFEGDCTSCEVSMHQTLSNPIDDKPSRSLTVSTAEMNHEQAREILAAACKALNALTAEIKQLPDRNHYWTGDIQVENWIVSITVNRKEDK